LRTEAYPLYGRSVFPPATRGDEAVHTVDVNEAVIEQARQRGQGGD